MNKFPITFWCAPPNGFTNEERYEEVAEAGFTLVCPPCEDESDRNEGPDTELNLKILDLCYRFGLKAVIMDRRINLALNGQLDWRKALDEVVADYKNHPALHSYYIIDEPGADLFPLLGEISEYLKIIDPVHPAYINLFPNYATPEQLQTHDYNEHLDRYIKEVRPSIISYDHYHFLKGNTEVVKDGFINDRDRQIYEAALNKSERPGFFENIEIVRKQSIKNNIPFMVIVLLVTHGPYRDLTESEIRWEVFQSLAYGASCVSYFTYWCPQDEPVWHFHNAIINSDGTRTGHFEEVKRINRELTVLGSKLLGRKSEAVYHIGKENEKVTYFTEHKDIKQIRGEKLTIGIFDDGYIMLANKDYSYFGDVELEITEGLKLTRISKKSGNEIIIPKHKNGYLIKLAPGDGELLRIV